MPSKYPNLTSDEVIKLLRKFGFIEISQKGSHKKLKKGKYTVIVPMHSSVAKGTLKSILNQAGLTLDVIQ